MTELRDIVKNLQSALARLQWIDLWPPWDAAITVGNAVREVLEIAFVPPRPDPAGVADVAAGWARCAQAWDESVHDLGRSARATPETVWDGLAGDAYRRSLAATATRFGSAAQAAHEIRRALTVCGEQLDDARGRHRQAQADLQEVVALPHLDWSLLDPSILVERVRSRVEDAATAIRTLIDAYADAADAVDECTAELQRRMDGVQLPRHAVTSMSAIAQTNLASSAGGRAQDTGPLRGTVAERAQAALDQMSAADRQAVEALLDAAGNDQQRAWIIAAVASGLGRAALADYARQLATLTPAQLRALDPTTSSGTYQQPDSTTCGSSSLVMARMLNDPAYAMYMVTGVDPRGELPDASSLTAAERFGAEAIAMHDRTNTLWPEPLGTFPTSVDGQMSAAASGSGVPGTTYASTIVDPAAPGATYDRILDAVSRGHAVPMYVYGIQEPGSGAHVTLIVGAEGDVVTVYEPGSGEYRSMTREEFTSGDVSGAASWTTPLTVSLPD